MISRKQVANSIGFEYDDLNLLIILTFFELYNNIFLQEFRDLHL